MREGLRIGNGALDQLLAVDLQRWSREVASREEHLAQFEGLPEPIWAAHRRLAQLIEGGLSERSARSSGSS
jgi:phosphoenolpyruvate carboxykinase (GTP)